MLECENCAYYWKEDSDPRPMCQYDMGSPWAAPCEEDEAYWDDEEEAAYWEAFRENEKMVDYRLENDRF